MVQSPIARIARPVSRFIQQEYSSGIVLLACVLIAVAWVNSPFTGSYHHLWELPLTIAFAGYRLSLPLHGWINDGLMAVFFFVIGLELKREFMAGELSSAKKALLPMGAAFGGMIIPALIYFMINSGTPAARGWGIPMATDIAFALGILSLAGKHVPPSLKIFLSALAVADDLGAILVIALFYSEGISLYPLAAATGFLLLLVAGNRIGIRHPVFYLVLGIAVWGCFSLSGIHATIAGVLVAFTIPARTRIDEREYAAHIRHLSEEFERELPDSSTLITSRQHEVIRYIKKISQESETPLQQIEYALHPWVAFGIMPLFALANAGIAIGPDLFSSLYSKLSIGIFAGLLLGKFTGILLFTWLLVRLRWSELPGKTNWRQMAGVASLAGIGFTMSLFITGLAFADQNAIVQSKAAILLASVIAATGGLMVLKMKRKQSW